MFSEHVLAFYKQLKPNWRLPKEIELIYPYDKREVLNLLDIFCKKYYSSNKKRYFLFGINPGRFGAGMTGVPFTDPYALSYFCKIPNDVKGQKELSSIFIYSMIEKYGGVDKFYKDFYISSICPLGFTKNGKNYNYYDDNKLLSSVEKKIVEAFNFQTSKYCRTDKAFSIGQGKNYKYFLKINEKHKWFDEVIPLPHPRWVMQYKRKNESIYIDEYLSKLSF